MVEQTAKQLNTPQPKTVEDYNFKWTTIALSEMVDRNLRLEANVYALEGKIAREILENCRWQLTTITGESGLATAYHRGRFRRIFVEKSELPIFQPSQITEIYPKPSLWISKQTKTNIDALKVKKNQVLISCSGTIGKCAIVGETLDGKILSHDLIRITTLSEFDAGYLYAFLKTEIGQTLLQTNNYGAVISHIEPSHLAEIPIPNPPPIIKTEIHNLVMKSSALRDESNSLIDQAEQLLINELNLPPIDELKVKYFDQTAVFKNFSVKLSELNQRLEGSFHNPISKSILNHVEQYAAEITTLANPQLVKNIILPGRFKRSYVEKGYGVVFFGGKELFQINPSGEKFLSLAQHSGRIKSELTLKENMIMVTCSGTIGKVAIVPKHWEGWTANQHIIRVVPTDKTNAGYIFAWLSSDYGKELIKRFVYVRLLMK